MMYLPSLSWFYPFDALLKDAPRHVHFQLIYMAYNIDSNRITVLAAH